MASYVEVVKTRREMCNYYTGIESGIHDCTKCPLNSKNRPHSYLPCPDYRDAFPEEAELIIMNWKPEPPKPEYPNWAEWLDKNVLGYGQWCTVDEFYRLLADTVITPELAAKLGIEPIIR